MQKPQDSIPVFDSGYPYLWYGLLPFILPSNLPCMVFQRRYPWALLGLGHDKEYPEEEGTELKTAVA